MRILHVIQRFYPYTGGSEIYFQELGEGFAADGHDVTVLTTDAWDLEHFWAPGRRTVDEPSTTHNGVHILRFPVRRAPGPPIVYPILRRLMVELGKLPGTIPLVQALSRITPRAPTLERYLATTGDVYDIVNSTNITLDFTIRPALAFARRRGIPHICTPFVHLGEPGSRYIVRYYTQPFQIEMLKRSQAVIVQTGLEAALLAAHGLPRTRMLELGGWVRPETLAGGKGARFRSRYGITSPIVLSIGAAAYDKGTFHAVEAMQRLWLRGVDAQLVLIASNVLAPFERFWDELAADVRARITLIKAASHADKLDALAAASVFAMPSRTDSFGIVYLEAWLYRLPVIGARAGGVPDVIDDGEDGYLIPFGDVDALAAKIERLLSDKQLAGDLGTRGHAKVLGGLTFAHKYARARDLYERVARGELPQT